MEIKTIKAAVVGCGAISDIYMQNLTERFQVIKLVACTDLNEERMRQQAKKYHLQAGSLALSRFEAYVEKWPTLAWN